MQQRIFSLLIIGTVILIFASFVFIKSQLKFTHDSTSATVDVAKSLTEKPASSTSKQCSGVPIANQQEGPYYKEGSPEKANLYQNSIPGIKLTITGYVLDANCQPIKHAWIDFWQADGNGNYDTAGFTLRGHQYTDDSGKYSLVTVVPGGSSDTPQIYVKVKATDVSPIVNSQLFVPGISVGTTDSIAEASMQLQDVKDTADGKRATFNFVVKTL